EHERRPDAANGERREERNRRPEFSVAREEIAGAAKPGEKRGGGREIERRGRARQVRAMGDVSGVSGVRESAVAVQVGAAVKLVRQVQVERPKQPGNGTQRESQQKADEIDRRPRHGESSSHSYCTQAPSAAGGGAAGGALSASSKRSTRCGVSTMVP